MTLGLATLLAAEEHHSNGNMLPGDLNELWWAIAAFVVIAALLYKFAFPPIKKMMAGRSTRIETELGVADAARAEALAEAQRLQASIGDAETDAAATVEDARRSAEQLRISLRERADQEAVELRQRALADIEAQKLQAIADLQAEVSALARGAAEAVVRHNLDEATQTSLIDDYINQVGA